MKPKSFFLLLILPLWAGSSSFLFAQSTEDAKIDKTNLVINEWISDLSSGHKYLDHTTTYNSFGRKIEEIEYDMKGVKWRKKFEYGSNGKIVKEMVYDYRNRLDNIRKYEYNEFSRRKMEYVYNAKGKLVKTKSYEYVYKK